MAGPPLLKSETGLNLVVTAWSGLWTLIAMAALGYVYVIAEPKYITFDPEKQIYVDKLQLQLDMLKAFGVAMVATGMAIAPLYQKDVSATGDAPVAGTGD